jgi:hypothetical protein
MKIDEKSDIQIEPIVSNLIIVNVNGLRFGIRSVGHDLKPEVRIELNDDMEYQLLMDRKDQIKLKKRTVDKDV